MTIHTKWTPAEQRFAAMVDDSAGPDSCWPWTGGTDDSGYGRLSVNNKRERAHRFAWAQNNGPIPVDRYVLHRCDNPPCCNPAHLFLGTIGDNNRDRLAKGRNGSYACHGDKNGRAKLSPPEVFDIRVYHQNGIKTKALADAYGVDRSTIRRIVAGKLWLADACLAAAEVE